MNILKEADKIINERSEEKTRQYGPFSEGMERAAKIATGMTGKEFTAKDVFKILIALKLSRESYFHKEDNLLDCVAYIGALNNFEDEELANNKQSEPKKDYVSTKERVEADLKDILSETGPNFKNDLEAEIFPQVKHAPGINDVISYQNYLSEKIGDLVGFVEHVAEHSNKQSEQLEKLTSEFAKLATKIYMDSTD